MNQQDKLRLFELQLQLDEMYEYKAKGAFVRSRGKWLEEGEKNSMYFFYLEKRNAELNSVLTLNINGEVSEDHVKISNYISTFYQTLYSKEDDGNTRLFLDSIKANAKCIDQDSMMSCDKDISTEEVRFGIS